jgi:hypothetical protein
MRLIVPSFLLAACSSAAAVRPDLDIDTVPAEETGTTITDSDTTDTTSPSEIDWSSLNGTLPPEALPAPEFLAHNFDNAVRDRDALIGHPTVMWFFPATGTPG